MNMMNKVFTEELDKFVVVLIGNVMIYFETSKEHECECVVLERLR